MTKPGILLPLVALLACSRTEQPQGTTDSVVSESIRVLVAVDEGAPKLLPRDEANDSFQAFRREALAALARKDTAFLYGMLSPVIKNSFGGDDSVSGFKRIWKPEEPGSAVWSHLTRVLSMGGRHDSDTTFRAPYVYAFWPDSLDAFDYVALTDSFVVVRRDSSASSPAVGAASHSIARAQAWSRFPSAQLPSDSTWVRVEFPGGTSGWISGSQAYSPVAWRAMFVREKGRWRMIVFVAGD